MALHVGVALEQRQQRLCLAQERLGAGGVERRAATGVDSALRESVTLAQADELGLDERERRLRTAQREVARSDLGENCDLDSALFRGGGAHFSGVGFGCAARAAEEINFPRGVETRGPHLAECRRSRGGLGRARLAASPRDPGVA